MSKTMYRINDLGAELGLTGREAPGPQGMSMSYEWTAQAAESVIARMAADPADEIVLDGHPAAWLVCRLAIALAPKTVSLFIPPLGGDIPVRMLSFGPEDPAGQISWKLTPFENGVLAQFELATRSYSPEDLSRVHLPEELKEQHIFFQGMAPNYVAGSMALSCVGACKSVSVAGMDGSFTCVWSRDGIPEPGTITAGMEMKTPRP